MSPDGTPGAVPSDDGAVAADWTHSCAALAATSRLPTLSWRVPEVVRAKATGPSPRTNDVTSRSIQPAPAIAPEALTLAPIGGAVLQVSPFSVHVVFATPAASIPAGAAVWAYTCRVAFATVPDVPLTSKRR